MKFLIFSILFLTAFAQENYDGPDYAPFDSSSIVPIQEMPGFWNNREVPKIFTQQINVRDRRIFGGVEVLPHSHPYQVALHITYGTGTALCGGSILTARSVLTAAHCTMASASTLVIAGVHNRYVIEPTQQRRTVSVSNYRYHPNYAPSTFTNDIAILITPSPAFTWTQHVQAVRRPAGAQINELFVNERARSTGWGRTTNVGETSGVLRKAYNIVITNAACAQVHTINLVGFGNLCTETTQSNQGTCVGDAGGVLSVERPPGNPMQIGITSFIPSVGCQMGFPQVYTRIGAFDAWINGNQNP